MWMIYGIWLLYTYYIYIYSMFWEVSNYSSRSRPMEEINFCILLLLVFLTSLSNSNDYNYDDYNYDQNYDYDNQKPEDYTDDYSQEYYDQNLLAPPNLPAPLPMPPPPQPMGKMTFFLF